MTRTWVIPDIHGYAETLRHLLKYQIKPGKNDHLIFLGDYIDRGPNSKGVIDIIMDLGENGYHITPLKGNHEESCIEVWDSVKQRKDFLGYQFKSGLQEEWEAFGGKTTLESFDAVRVYEIPEKYIQWMRSLKYYVELDQFIAVHAGFNFNADDPFNDTHAMIWIRDYEIIPEKIKYKKIIHGHDPVNLALIDLFIKKSDNFPFINLDNGIYVRHEAGYGNLVALELNTMKYKIQPVVDEINYRGKV